jgi:hypothetical protein
MAKRLTPNLHTKVSKYVCCRFHALYNYLWLLHLAMREEGINLKFDFEQSQSCVLGNAGHAVRPTYYTLHALSSLNTHGDILERISYIHWSTQP